MKVKTYHTIGTIPTSNLKIVGKDKINTPNEEIHDRLFSWFNLSIF